MNGEADHLDFSLELNLTADGVSVFEPLDRHNQAISETPFVDIPETAFADQVLAAEVVCCSLKLSELEPLQVSKAYFFMMLL